MYCKPRKTRNTYRGRAATTTKEKRCFPVNRAKLTNTTLVTGEQRYEDLYTTFRSEYPRCLHGFDRICFRGTRHFLAQYGPVCLVSCGSGKGFAKSGLGAFSPQAVFRPPERPSRIPCTGVGRIHFSIRWRRHKI